MNNEHRLQNTYTSQPHSYSPHFMPPAANLSYHSSCEFAEGSRLCTDDYLMQFAPILIDMTINCNNC